MYKLLYLRFRYYIKNLEKRKKSSGYIILMSAKDLCLNPIEFLKNMFGVF